MPLDGTSEHSKFARSELGSHYKRFPDSTTALFGDEGASLLFKELKAHQGAHEEGELAPFADAEPFALH